MDEILQIITDRTLEKQFGLKTPFIEPIHTWTAFDIIENKTSHSSEEIELAQKTIGIAVIKGTRIAINKKIKSPEDERQHEIWAELIKKVYDYYISDISGRIKKYFPDIKRVKNNCGAFSDHMIRAADQRLLNWFAKEKLKNQRDREMADLCNAVLKNKLNQYIIQNEVHLIGFEIYHEVYEMLRPDKFTKHTFSKLAAIQDLWNNIEWGELRNSIDKVYSNQFPEWLKKIIIELTELKLLGH